MPLITFLPRNTIFFSFGHSFCKSSLSSTGAKINTVQAELSGWTENGCFWLFFADHDDVIKKNQFCSQTEWKIQLFIHLFKKFYWLGVKIHLICTTDKIRNITRKERNLVIEMKSTVLALCTCQVMLCLSVLTAETYRTRSEHSENRRHAAADEKWQYKIIFIKLPIACWNLAIQCSLKHVHITKIWLKFIGDCVVL